MKRIIRTTLTGSSKESRLKKYLKQMNDEIAPELDENPITLGGVFYRVVEFQRRTVAMDHYLTRLMRSTGVDKVIPMDGETNDIYIVRLQTCLVDSQKLPEILGGMLMPIDLEDSEWDGQIAKATTVQIRKCSAPEDRELVLSLGFDLVMRFFVEGVALLNRSQSYFDRLSMAAPKNLPH